MLKEQLQYLKNNHPTGNTFTSCVHFHAYFCSTFSFVFGFSETYWAKFNLNFANRRIIQRVWSLCSMRGKWVLIDVNWSLKIKFKLETWLKTAGDYFNFLWLMHLLFEGELLLTAPRFQDKSVYFNNQIAIWKSFHGGQAIAKMPPTKPTQERAKLCQQAELWVIFHGYGFFFLAPGKRNASDLDVKAQIGKQS